MFEEKGYLYLPFDSREMREETKELFDLGDDEAYAACGI
jgi:hypothetical protein